MIKVVVWSQLPRNILTLKGKWLDTTGNSISLGKVLAMKILLATDGSADADLAAWFLAHLPHDEPLELDVLSVLFFAPIAPVTTLTERWTPHTLSEERRLEAEKNLDKVEQKFQGANVSVQRHIAEGHIGKTIIEHAEKLKSDLIVLGAQGHSAIARLLLGSVSDFVATHAPCSVLVVRDTGLREENHRQLRVCIGYDDSPPSRLALNEMGRFGWGSNTQIDVVHMVALPTASFQEIPIQLDVPAILASTEEMVRDAAEELRSITPNLSSHVEQCAHVGLGLADYANDRKTDVLVVGDTGRSRLERFFLGSVARNALRHAKCSVWITRQPRQQDT